MNNINTKKLPSKRKGVFYNFPHLLSLQELPTKKTTQKRKGTGGIDYNTQKALIPKSFQRTLNMLQYSILLIYGQAIGIPAVFVSKIF